MQLATSGRILKTVGVAIVLVSLISPLTMEILADVGMPLLPPVSILAVMTPLGAFLYYRGRQLAALARAKSTITATTRHVLYLRAFKTDPSFKKPGNWQLLGTEEEKLADVLRPFGNLLAIGRPGERLPPAGAARIYCSPEEWKDVVRHQMQAARLVVIRADAGEGVFWELTQAIKVLDHPQKLLILVLNMWGDYELFRTRTSALLPIQLPLPKRWRSSWPRSGFIGFDEDWTPRFLPLGGLQYSLKGRLKYALKPVFQSFGLEWKAPSISVARVIATLFVLVAVPLGLVRLWEGPPFNSAVFKDRETQQVYARTIANACKSIHKWESNGAKRCDCLAQELVQQLNNQEFEDLEKELLTDSFRKKIKRLKCHNGF
jgi:hypothetical protein